MAQRTGRPRGLTADGPKIRRLRRELGLTAAQLGPQIGAHPKSLLQIEANGRPISVYSASRLAKALGVHMSDITNWPREDDSESDAETKIPA